MLEGLLSPLLAVVCVHKGLFNRQLPVLMHALLQTSLSSLDNVRGAGSCATKTVWRAQVMDSASHPALLLVDGVSSIGALEFKFDEWGVDMAVTGSQKALSLPTGLALVAASPKVGHCGTSFPPAHGSGSMQPPAALLGLALLLVFAPVCAQAQGKNRHHA